jgi:hypothetical protein
MPERMIEAAYRKRLASRRQRELDLRELHAEFTEVAHTYATDSVIVAVARPIFPQFGPPIAAPEAAKMFEMAWSTPWLNAVEPYSFAPRDLVRRQTPQRGLRRYRQVGHRSIQLKASTYGGCSRDLHRWNRYTSCDDVRSKDAYVRFLARCHGDRVGRGEPDGQLILLSAGGQPSHLLASGGLVTTFIALSTSPT